MNKGKWKKKNRGRETALALAACLLAAALTGCGGKEEEESVFDEITESAAPEESGEKEDILSAAELVQRLEEGMEGAGNVSLERNSSITGKAVIEDGTYPVKARVEYRTEINGEESAESVSKDVSRDDGSYASCSFRNETGVLPEGGQQVTYVVEGYNDSGTREAGDALNAEQKIKELLECFGDTGLTLTGNGYGTYTLGTELSGENLRELLAKYCGFTAEELEYPDTLSAGIQMNAYFYEKSCSMDLTINCDELSQAIFSPAYGVEAEGGTFSLSVRFSAREEKSEYFFFEKPEKTFEGNGVRLQEHSASELLCRLMDEIYADSLMEGFQRIREATEPVMLRARGMTVTVGFSQGLREKGTLSQQTGPNKASLNLYNVENIGYIRDVVDNLDADIQLNSEFPESFLAKSGEDYLSAEGREGNTNLEFQGSRTIEAEMGQAQVISFSYDYKDEYHIIQYYAALPLENGKVLSVEIKSRGKAGDESHVCDDDMVKTILNCCAVGGEAPQVSGNGASQDSGDGSAESAAENVRFASVEELLQDPSFGSNFYDAAEAMASSSGQEVTVRADGENVVFTMTLNPPPSGSTYDIEGLKTSFDKNFSSEEMVQVTGMLAALLKQYAATEDPKVIWEIYTDKGEVLLTKEYSPIEGTFSIE